VVKGVKAVDKSQFNEQLKLASKWVRANRSRPDYDEETIGLVNDLKNECNRVLSSIERAMKRGY